MSYEIIETAENHRKVKVADKVVSLNREDPWGLWFFQWDAGEPPAVLSGAFTSPGSAIEFLENYFLSISPPKRHKNAPVREE